MTFDHLEWMVEYLGIHAPVNGEDHTHCSYEYHGYHFGGGQNCDDSRCCFDTKTIDEGHCN